MCERFRILCVEQELSHVGEGLRGPNPLSDLLCVMYLAIRKYMWSEKCERVFEALVTFVASSTPHFDKTTSECVCVCHVCTNHLAQETRNEGQQATVKWDTRTHKRKHGGRGPPKRTER